MSNQLKLQFRDLLFPAVHIAVEKTTRSNFSSCSHSSGKDNMVQFSLLFTWQWKRQHEAIFPPVHIAVEKATWSNFSSCSHGSGKDNMEQCFLLFT